MKNIQIKKLTKTAKIPTRGSSGAAGYDLYIDSIEWPDGSKTNNDNSDPVEIKNNMVIKIHTGIAIAIPEGYVGLIFPRSGLATKQGLRLSNCVGVIDEDYRGEIIVPIHADEIYGSDKKITTINLNDRIAQIVFVNYQPVIFEETDELTSTERNTGGFGSTGIH